jgi:hypothetical protein
MAGEPAFTGEVAFAQIRIMVIGIIHTLNLSKRIEPTKRKDVRRVWAHYDCGN